MIMKSLAWATPFLLGVAALPFNGDQAVMDATAPDAQQKNPNHHVNNNQPPVVEHLSDSLKQVFDGLLGRVQHGRYHPEYKWKVVRGADVQSMTTQGADGQPRRKYDGNIDTYDLRTKAVDPSALGVDPGVKQYSGYLDDNENDKHLFYCEYQQELCTYVLLISNASPTNSSYKGFSSPVTTPKPTRSCCGSMVALVVLR